VAEPAWHPASAPSVAVVGLACRFPDADDAPMLLDTILTRRRAFRRLPPSRLDLTEYDGAARARARAGLIEGWEFDRAAFRIPDPVYRSADPAHWLALETAARALAAAGFPGGAGLDRDRIGVIFSHTPPPDPSLATVLRTRWPDVRRVLAESLFAGDVKSDRARRVLRHAAARYLAPLPRSGADSLASSPVTIPARISSYFGFRGGSQAVDSACASSLQAVASACAALAARDIDVAIAGGVDLSLDPLELAGLTRPGQVATGDVRIYDENPTGYLPGEGCGVVVLMRTAQARAAGLPVYAEIAGWGTSAGGLPGVVASDASSQMLALHRAYERAGVDPREVQFIEGHGCGTSDGDDAELIALAELRDGAREAAALGSIKANIGHAKAAAGVAGLIKTVLALGTGVIPPTTGADRPHPLLRGPDAAFWLPEMAEEWPAGPRLAGVSAMGVGGVNVHLVLRGTPGRGRYDRMLRALPRLARPGTGRERATGGDRVPQPAGRPAAFLLHARDRQQLAATLARVAQLAAWLSDAELTDLACQLGRDARVQGPVRVAIVASDQEELARLAGEALALLPGLRPGLVATRPGIFAADNADGRVTLLLSDEAGADVTAAGDGTSSPDAITSSLAALRWLESLEVSATAAVSHGLGEIAGLAWAGVLGEADVTEIAALRAEFLRGPAVRVLVPAGRPAQGPGDPRSPATDAASLLRSAMTPFRFGPPRRRLISTLTGRELATSDEVIDLICRGFSGQDRLAEAVTAGAQGATLLVETGPGRLLAATAARVCRVPTVGMGWGEASGADLARAAAGLFAAGALGQVAPIFAGQQVRPIDLWRDQVFITGPGQDKSLPGPAAGPAAGQPRRPQLASAGTHRAVRPGTGGRRGTGHRGIGRAGGTPAGPGQPDAAAGGCTGGTSPAGPAQAGAGPASGASGPVTGLASWARCFTEEVSPVAVPPGPGADRLCRIVVAESYPFRQEVDWIFGHDPAAGCSLAIIGDAAAPGAMQAALAAAQEARRTGRLVAITTGTGVTGLLASVQAEQPSLGITVLRIPATPGGLRSARRYASVEPGQFRELVIGADGTARELVPAAREVPGGAEFPLDGGDVVLVSRESSGAALALAQVLAACGAAVAVIGRAGPGDDGAAVAGLEELRIAGAQVSYEIVDAASPADMALAVRRIERRYGPVTAIGHAVGPADSMLVADLTPPALDAHLLATRAALRDLLAPVTAQQLRLILTFGSTAARHGLPRQGLLAAASMTLASQAEAAAAAIPGCRALHFELPGWSGGGLGTRPGLAASMAEAGMSAIGVSDVSRLLLKALATPGLPDRVALHGRIGAPSDIRPDGDGPSGRRAAGQPAAQRVPGLFQPDVVLHYPGIELVREARLSLATDPYLADYRVDGRPVLPPVIALEALAQAASALAGRPLRQAAAVTVAAPVVLRADDPTLIRVCALADGDKIIAALRSAESGMLVDHVRAEFRRDDALPAPAPGVPGMAASGMAQLPPGPAADIVDGADLYGPICFQSGRFRRIAALTEITSRSCRATARGADNATWFPAAEAGGLLLGSPGLNDAALQVLQACAADRRVWLAGCDSVSFSGAVTDGAAEIRAIATSRPAAPGQAGLPGSVAAKVLALAPRPGRGSVGGPAPAASPDEPPASSRTELTWDVAVVDAAGQPLVTWRGIRLREARTLPRDQPWSPALLPVYLERGAVALGLDPALRIVVRSGAAARAAVAAGTGRPAGIVPQPRSAAGLADPVPTETVPTETVPTETVPTETVPTETVPTETVPPGFLVQAGGARFAASGWAVADPQHPVWPANRDDLAATFSRLCSHLSEPPVASAARLQAVAECLAMAQAPAGAPVLFDRATEDGWALLEVAGGRVACTVVQVRGLPCPVAIAITTDLPRRDPRGGRDRRGGRGAGRRAAARS
jgi:enediyne polyketide synthase